MKEWIIKAHTKVYNHLQSLRENGFIDWTQRVDYEIGDIVYICFVGELNGIKVKTKVTKSKMTSKEAYDDVNYWNNKRVYHMGKSGIYARLELVEILEDIIPTDNLVKNNMHFDIKYIQGITDHKLSVYIDSYFTK